jgi:hypothetical protein
MKSTLLTSTLVASAILLIVLGSSPMVFGYSATASSGSAVLYSSGQASPTLTKVSVTVSFSPKTVSTTPGHSVKNTMTVTDKASVSYAFKSCELFYKLSSSSKYTKATCSLNGKTISVSPGKSVSFGWYTTPPSGFPKGTYNIEVILTNSVDQSGPGTYNLDVT